ncbi:MAG: hypothetical protein QXH91_07865 [Candidatus Bathyarchaeia archaeon]
MRDKFEEDLDKLLERLNGEDSVMKSLMALRQKLVDMKRENLVKSNHSLMEILCANNLIRAGYEVEVEWKLSQSLVCDIFATKGEGSLIVEVETGFVPPEHALDPNTYTAARIVSKISRYSPYANKFSLGVPPYVLLPIPLIFIKPPKDRSDREVSEFKYLCDPYYNSPPISESEIRNARLHSIYIIDVDRKKVEELNPEEYAEERPKWNLESTSILFD